MYGPSPLLLPALLPLSWLYGAVVRLRARRYAGGSRSERLDLPVVSAGNLTVGGAGKTPFVAACARLFLEAGLRPAVLSRGYGRAGAGPLLLSEGGGPLAPWRESGDEPWLLATQLPGVLVAVGPDRAELGRALAGRTDLGVDVLLLDDGFQHQRLRRDLDLVLVRADDPFGNGRLLPAGPLREPVSALRRADAVVLTYCPDSRDPAVLRLEERLRRESGREDLPVLHADLAPRGLRTMGGMGKSAGEAESLRGLAVSAFCGLAEPSSFRRTLDSLGARIVRWRTFRDHHPYSPAEAASLMKGAREAGALALVTTEKDAVRLEGLLDREDGPPLLALSVEMVLEKDDHLREMLLAVSNRPPE